MLGLDTVSFQLDQLKGAQPPPLGPEACIRSKKTTNRSRNSISAVPNLRAQVSQPENANSLNRPCIIMPNRHHLLMTDSEVEFFKALGSRVSQLRRDQGLTQTELAEPLGITQPMLAS